MSNSLITLEFNEICPDILSRYMAQGLLPNFQRFYDNSEVYVTEALESKEHLEPWIQWVTVHTGQSYAEHNLFNLDEGHQLPNEQIWSEASRQGKKVWVCGSMNLGHDGNLNGFALPDPWARNVQPHPPGEFEDYLSFVSQNVLEHTNADAPVSMTDRIKFVNFIVKHGMSLKLAQQIVQQLLTEKRSGKFRWKRASILDRIQWHVFRSYYQKHKPDFSTLFLNSVAHFQHVYWRNMDPDLFETKPTPEEQAEYESAILGGYQVYDSILGDCMQLAGDDTQIALVSGLSQKPCLKYENSGGKRAYRPNDFPQLMDLAGINTKYECTPVMTEEFLLRFENDTDAGAALLKLEQLQVAGVTAMRVRQDNNELMIGCGIYTDLPEDSTICNGSAGNEGVRFFDMFYKIEDIKSGEHDPRGVFWLWRANGEHTVHNENLSLTEVAPKLRAILYLEEQSRLPTAA